MLRFVHLLYAGHGLTGERQTDHMAATNGIQTGG